MNMEEFLDRVCDGEMKAGDIPPRTVLHLQASYCHRLSFHYVR